jgi:hypothetical protein
MDDATYVLFAARGRRAKLRDQLRAQLTEPLRWTECRRLFGSEFLINGPPALAREAHESLVLWLNRVQASR